MRLSPSGQDGVTRMAFSTLPEKILKIDKLYERVFFQDTGPQTIVKDRYIETFGVVDMSIILIM